MSAAARSGAGSQTAFYPAVSSSIILFVPVHEVGAGTSPSGDLLFPFLRHESSSHKAAQIIKNEHLQESGRLETYQ